MPNSMSTNSVSLWRVRAGTNATDNTATSGALLLSTKRSGADLLLQSVFSCSLIGTGCREWSNITDVGACEYR